jgi:two-component system sensor histidine kinase BaeS
MSLSIVQKLVAAFIGLTLLVLIATLGLARWSFQQGFLDYVNALEQVRLERIQAELARDYVAADNQWDFLTDAYFGNMLRRTSPSGQLAPPRPRERNAAEPAQRDGRPPPPGGPGRAAGLREPPGLAAPPTALYDSNDRRIAGTHLSADATRLIRVPVIANGEIVGELRSEPRRQVDSPLETAFSKQQLTTSWIIGLTSLALALLVSLLLARGLSAPVKRMIGGVGKLSAGDYSHRMQESRRDELGQLTRDIDHLAMTLEETQLARRRLLADVSHELRTPLTVLSGEIEALKDGLRAFDETQLTSLDQEVQRLRFLVDDLYELSLSDVGGLRYQFEHVDLRECVRDALRSAQARASDTGLELLLNGADNTALPVKADVRRIEQLLGNLLENALAYTDPPGRINVELSRTQTTATVRIDDSPPGVNAAECERLFDPLYRRESSRTRRSGGAGLGLAICRNIVIAHGGTISATPSSLGGISVIVELPLCGVHHT